MEALCCKFSKPFINQDITILFCTLRIFSRHCGLELDILELLLSDRAAYILSPYQHWWKEMLKDLENAATRVIYIHLFMLLVLISALSDMQHPIPQVIQQ